MSPQKVWDYLRRFGIPDDFVIIIKATYLVKRFYVKQSKYESK